MKNGILMTKNGICFLLRNSPEKPQKKHPFEWELQVTMTKKRHVEKRHFAAPKSFIFLEF